MNEINTRILFLTNIPSPYRVDFFNELGRKCKLTVLFEQKSSLERDANWHSSSFDHFNAIFLRNVTKSKNIMFCPGVIKFLSKSQFDIIVIGGYSTLTGMFAINYLRLRKIPFVLNSDGGIINKRERNIKSWIKKYFISSAEFWLSTGKETTAYLEYYGAKYEKIYVYPFTTLLEDEVLKKYDKALKQTFKSKLDISEEKVILSVGRFIYEKGFDVLLNAARDISPKYGIYIVGGEPTEEYIKLKQDLNLTNVYFIGFKSREELKEYYLSADLFVLPTRGDVWGLVINEAMANGLPIITTDKCVAGLELVKNQENGFIVPVNDSAILARKINELIKDNLVLEKVSISNLNKIKNYTIENMVDEHIKIFMNINSIFKKGNSK